jgi:hypothetical protein
MPSSAIEKIDYCVGNRTLSVWFVPTGHRYDYFEVPPDLYRAFLAARSKGRFFNTRIRDHFAYRRRAVA